MARAKTGRPSGEEIDKAFRDIAARLQDGRAVDRDKLCAGIATLLGRSGEAAEGILCDFLFSQSGDGESDIRIVGKKIEMHRSSIAARWKETPVGARLNDSESMRLKTKLALKVVDIFIDNDIPSVLLSSGTTSYCVLRSLLGSHSRLSLRIVYSNSLLILDHFLEHQPGNVELELLGGRVDKRTAALVGDFDLSMGSKRCSAAVVAFTALSKSGLYVSEDWEVLHLHKLIRHRESSEIVVIPMTLNKLGSKACHGAHLIEGGLPQKETDAGTKHRYILVTNRPERGDSERNEILEHWRKHVGEVMYADD